MKSIVLLLFFIFAVPSFAVECTPPKTGNVNRHRPRYGHHIIFKSKDIQIENLKRQVEDLKDQLRQANYKVDYLQSTIMAFGIAAPRETILKNSVGLIVPIAPTKLVVSDDNGQFKAETQRQADVGIMYQRDFDRIRGTAGISLQGIGLLGVGYNF